MLTCIQTLIHPDHDILAPLSDRLKMLLKGLMISNPDNFVGPRAWAKYRDVIMSNLGSDDNRFTAVLSAIDRRNSRLITAGAKKETSPRRLFIQLLDGARKGALSTDLARDFWKIEEDKAMLLRTVLEWSTSSHRPGITKIYVAARIIRSWSKLGVDVTSTVLAFLDSKTCDVGRSKPSLYHLISELARSEHFSTPKYLQWLIARGGLYDTADVAPDGPGATRLLAELPTHNVSESIVDLRATLLSRVDFLVEDEEEKLRDTMIFINRKLPGMQGNVDSDLEGEDIPDIEHLTDHTTGLSRTEKSELGLWLRQKVKLQMVQPTIPPLDDWDDSPMKKGTSAISLSDFSIVRRYLEEIDDYSMLADVLKIVTSSNDPEVLASCADTLDLHIDTFAAIGAMKGLFDILMSRLRAITADADTTPRVFLVSLSSLASRLPEQNFVARQLAQELALSDRKTAADACSPVSDHMAIVETAEATFTDEIEKILASGNSMDQAILERLFQRIIMRLEASWKKSPEQQRSCALLLTRLRTFDIPQFDVLMTTWVRRVFHMQTRPNLMQIFAPLISFGCVALRDLLDLEPINDKEIDSKGATMALEILALLLTASDLPEVMTNEEAYRFRVKQAHVKKDCNLETLTAVYKAFEGYNKEPSSGAKTLLGSIPMHELLQDQALQNTDCVIQKLVMPLLNGSNTEAISAIDGCINKLLVPNNSMLPITTETLLDLADDLTLPFCQVKLAAMFRSEDTVMGGTEDHRSKRLEAFDAAIESAIASGSTAWASIVPLLDVSIAQHLRRRVESQFLALFPSPRSANGDESRIKNAENLLHVIEATAYSIPTSSSPIPNQSSLAPEIVTTLNGIRLLLSNSQSQELKDVITSKWLPLLLSFITIHASAYEASKPGSEARAKTILGLAAIFLQLQAFDTSTDPIPSLIEQTFDLALHLVDSLPEDMRQQCIRSLRDTASNPRMSYLFSYTPNPTEWLMLSQREKIPGLQPPPAGSGAAERERWEREREREKLVPFVLRRWEMLGEPTPNVGENDTSLSLTLFGSRRG
jgi:mediator of RNA polymerase II transcription subunit 12